jgi:hypothetical protein
MFFAPTDNEQPLAAALRLGDLMLHWSWPKFTPTNTPKFSPSWRTFLSPIMGESAM